MTDAASVDVPNAEAPTAALPIADLQVRRGDQATHEQAARGMFDGIAPTYDAVNRLLSAGVDNRWRESAVRELGRAPAGPVLDVCSGTMELAAMVAHTRPHDLVVAVDFSESMLALGKRKAPTVEAVVANVTKLPFEDDSFAAALCGFGMRNLSNVEHGAREVRRVLRPGGVFVTLDFFRPTLAPARAFHRAYARWVLPAIGGLVSGNAGAYRYLARSIEGFLSRSEYERLLCDLGFSRIEGRELTLGIASIVRAQVPP